MIIRINQELSVETEIPIQSIIDFYMVWEVNAHAELHMTGILEPDMVTAQPLKEHKIKIMFSQEIIFWGIIWEVQRVQQGITTVRIRASSASIQLDQEKLDYAYQNVTKTYSDIVKERVEALGGDVICIADRQQIEKPVICYRETSWDFIRRLASRQNTCVIADILTGEPNVWYGMKKGKQIGFDLLKQKVTVEVEKSYDNPGVPTCVKAFEVECVENYLLGDKAELYGDSCVIYKKQMRFENGSVRFIYNFVDHVAVKAFYNEIFTGLSLTGTVDDVKEESLRVSFDIGGKSEQYYYPWRPETGNALYEMPEKGTKVMVYFRDCDEQNGVVVRCLAQSDGEWEKEDKVNQISDDVYVDLGRGGIEIKKSGEQMRITDSKIGFLGSGIIIEGNGRVKLQAKNVNLSASSEIRVVAAN